MKTLKLAAVSLALAIAMLPQPGLFAQHGHLNAGAATPSQGSPLLWVNGAEFEAGSGYLQPMAFATSGRYAGLYNSGPTLTALSMTIAGASAPGSFLTTEIVSVTGPGGGLFSFWEGVDQGGGAEPTFSIAAGSTGLSHQFALSDTLGGAGQPGGDPYGHLHGRRFTATSEGLYTVGFRVLDTSANGTGGGPIHLPSDVLYLNFATVPEPSILALLGLGLGGAWLFRRRKV